MGMVGRRNEGLESKTWERRWMESRAKGLGVSEKEREKLDGRADRMPLCC